MGQPLASEEWMRRHGKSLMKAIQELDELAEQDSGIVDYVCITLCKALREDWKYNVLFDLPQFEEVYRMHKKIVLPVEERTHLKRLHNFQRVLAQLGDWAATGESARRMQEVELDIADIKNYLQSFYAELQNFEQEEKIVPSEEKGKKISGLCESFLDYLYLFGQFFHRLPHNHAEGQILRQKLLFADQYFDAIEEKLHALD
jgi:hypothetical protein